ncbi:MAG: XRE family transcriptional regulator [Pseudonocardiaceae bacterium]
MEWTPPRIRLFRDVGLCQSQHDFAKTLGVAKRTVGNAERGAHPPSLALRRALDQALEHASDVQRARFLAAVTTEDQSIVSPIRATTPATFPALSFTAAPSLITFPVTSYADTAYLEAVQQHIWQIVALDNRFGGTDLASLAVRFFRSVHQQLGSGAYEPAIERDLQAAVGELAEIAGWLLYDANRQDDVRRMNQEALYFSRLAGDRTMELLTLQNASMHAGFLGRPHEALQLASSVLESRDRLSPRVKTLFLMRKARALAQGGDEQALRLFDQVRSHYADGMRDSDPKWAWWIDECELAWHEGMALADLGCPREAVGKFEQSVEAMPPHGVRGRYLHLGYLLGAQVKAAAWSDAETTMCQIGAMVGDVASARAVVLLGRILPQLKDEHVPGSTRDTAEQLALLLSRVTV